MTPAAIRNQNFSELRQSLPAMRLAVWAAWCAVKQGTTRDISRAAGMDILIFRPRTTELFAMGLLCLIDHQPGNGRVREGIYRARTEAEWEAWKCGQASAPAGQQQLL